MTPQAPAPALVAAGEGSQAIPRLHGVELVKVVLPLAEPWHSAAGCLDQRESLLVRVVVEAPAGGGATAQVEGWGECTALPWPTYNAEYTDGAAEVASRFVVPFLQKKAALASGQVQAALSWLKGHNMLKSAFEMAFLDAEARLGQLCLADYLSSLSRRPSSGPGPGPSTGSGSRPGTGQEARAARVPAGVVIGLGAAVMDEVALFVEQGYRRVKLKVRPTEEVATVAAVRHQWPELVIMADANGAYEGLGIETASGLLAGLAPYGVACVEQPLAADDLAGHAELARRCGVPICLDESLTSLSMLELALDMGACSVVSIKPGRMGGYIQAVRALDLCAERGVPAWCGGMVETGLGRAGNLAIASLPGFTLPGDMSASSRFFPEDITPPTRVGPDGYIDVPTGPGLGVEPEPAALARHTAWRS